MAALDGEPNATSPLVEQRWAELYVTPRNPAARWTSRLARRVAADLAARGWELETVMTDSGSELRSRQFGETVAALGARQRFIHAGRPRANGCVERVRGTILEECWKPPFARHLIPKQNGLRRDLVRYLDYYNTDRAHTGRWTRDRTPESVIGKAKLWSWAPCSLSSAAAAQARDPRSSRASLPGNQDRAAGRAGPKPAQYLTRGLVPFVHREVASEFLVSTAVSHYPSRCAGATVDRQ